MTNVEGAPDTTVTVTWLRELIFDGELDGHHVILDAGKSDDSRGPSPTRFLLAGLAGCTAMDVIGVLRKQRQKVDDLQVRVDGYRVEDHPRRFHTMRITSTVRGTDLDRAAVERAVNLSQDKYCSVAATLRESAAIDMQIELEESEPGS